MTDKILIGTRREKVPLGFVLEVLPADPAVGYEGRCYYNSTTKGLRYYNGSAWADMGGGGDVPAGVEMQANKGIANGYAGLDGSAKVALQNLPAGNAEGCLPALGSALAQGEVIQWNGTSFVGLALGSVLRYKGSVATYEALLQVTGQVEGDVYNVEQAYSTYPAGTNFAWTGTAWDALGGSIDLTNYATHTYVADAIGSAERGFRGDLNVVTDLGLTTQATTAEIATALGNHTFTPAAAANEYVRVYIPTGSATADRYELYSFNGTAWAYVLTLANSGFTPAQWGAVNSGADATKIGILDTYIAGTAKVPKAVDADTAAAQASGSALETAINGKQALLVSGTNIKTINGQSILGSGDLPVSGGGGSKFVYRVAVDWDVFQTDPTLCVSYRGDAVGFNPVDNHEAQTLQSAASVGDWDESNPLIESMYYATFNDDGSIAHVLDPSDLTKDIEGNDMSTEITQKDVMLVIPTLYTYRDAEGISISNDPTKGTAYAHTYGGHTFKNLAVAVYPGTIDGSGKLRSLSGQTPSHTKTRAEFRAAANLRGTRWMLPNYHVWSLLRDLTILTTKSFDGQRRLGQGFSSGGSSQSDLKVNGLANALGRFAGDATGTGSVVKCFIEHPWGQQYWFLDDIITGQNGSYWTDLYVGQNLVPTDDTVNKVLIADLSARDSGYGVAVDKGDLSWGLANDVSGGSDAKGLCDYQYFSKTASSARLGYVGGDAYSGSLCGPSCLNLDSDLSSSRWFLGARSAFVFD